MTRRHYDRTRHRLDPHTDARPEPIEILARMAGRSTFRTPKQPGATTAVPVTPLDIAHAVATAQDKLGSAMAMAMACQRPYEWHKVERTGHARVLAHLQAQRDYPGIVDAPYTHRARIALYDAFHDLIVPEHRRNLGVAAKDARMPRAMYRHLLRETCGYLEHAANTAAADACRYLFANHIESAKERGEDMHITIDVDGVVLLEAKPTIDIGQLCRDVIERPRRPGLLEMKR